MDRDKLNELGEELRDALQAIEILTNRLVNLAVIENKFLSLVEKLRYQETKCAGILCNIVAAEKRVDDKTSDLKYFFKFRFKWIERLIMKHKIFW